MSDLASKLVTVAINVTATLGVVAANKLLFKNSVVPVTTLTLTWLHYVSGAIFSRIAIACGAFEYKHVPWNEVFKVYFLNMLAILAQNVSLQYNSIDFYQLMKALVLPWSAVVDICLRGQKLGKHAAISVTVITTGAVLVAVSDLSALTCTFVGLMAALVCVGATPLPIAYFGPVMRKYQVSALQLFTQGSVAGAVMMTPVVLVELMYRAMAAEGAVDADPTATAGMAPVDTGMMSASSSEAGSSVLASAESSDADASGALLAVLPVALFSCLSAYGINFTVNAMARDWQGVTYFVINTAKGTLIITMGVFVFGNGELPLQKFLGILLAVGGQFSYPFAKQGINPCAPGAFKALMLSGNTAPAERSTPKSSV